jgi:dihydrofolate reductase
VSEPGLSRLNRLIDELQAWVMARDPVDTEILERATAATGAVVMGRRLFDIVDGPDVWTKDMAYGAQPAGTLPFFVITHSVPRDVRLERELGMRFSFVHDLVSAVNQARTAAIDGHVVIMGGGDVIGQAIERASWTSCICTSPRCCSVAEHRCFGRARARCIGKVTSALRATPSTSPTSG